MSKTWAIAFIVLTACAVFTWQYLKPVPPVTVEAERPTARSFATTLDLNAVLINSQIVSVTALLDGRISRIEAREGDSIKAGQVMAVIDDTMLQTQLAGSIDELKYSEQQLKFTSQNYARVENLYEAGNASKQSLQESLDEFLGAVAEKSASQMNVTLTRLMLENTTIKAPFDGVVVQQHAEAGQWLEAGTQLFELVAEQGYLIEAYVDASDWAMVSIDQAVSLSTESAPGEYWQSHVTWIAPAVSFDERDARTVAIRLPIGEGAPPLLMGQELDAELVMEHVDDVLSLPLSSMIENEYGEYSVFVAIDGKARSTPVSVGLQNAVYAQITDGLSPDDAVITSREQALNEDMPIVFDQL